jgi:hypothetical protein
LKPNLYCGQTLTFHVLTTNATGLDVLPFSQIDNWQWAAGTHSTIAAANAWITVSYTLPSINFLGLQAIGLNVYNTSASSPYSGDVYIDGITWQ